jgi:hypothetical protein
MILEVRQSLAPNKRKVLLGISLRLRVWALLFQVSEHLLP